MRVATWAPPSLFVISSTAAAIGWTIPLGILFPFRPGYVRLAEPYHVVPLESSAALLHAIWVNIASLFYTILMPICYVVYLMIANTWTYISLYIHQEYCYLGKQKISLYFSASTFEYLWPSHSHLINCTKYQ